MKIIRVPLLDQVWLDISGEFDEYELEALDDAIYTVARDLSSKDKADYESLGITDSGANRVVIYDCRAPITAKDVLEVVRDAIRSMDLLAHKPLKVEITHAGELELQGNDSTVTYEVYVQGNPPSGYTEIEADESDDDGVEDQ